MIYNMAYRIYDAAQTSYSFAKTQTTRIYNSLPPVVQNLITHIGMLFAEKDSLEMARENLRQLQELNTQTGQIIEDFEKISSRWS